MIGSNIQQQFRQAVIDNNIELAKSLIFSNINAEGEISPSIDPDAVLDKEGNTPLHFAIIRKRSEIARALIFRGTNVAIKNTWGETALHLVLRYDLTDIVSNFLEENQDSINTLNNRGETPLHVASLKANIEAMKALLKFGAKTNVLTYGGESPLHYAARSGKVDAFIAILNSDADPHGPFDERCKKNTEILKELLKMKFDFSQLSINNFSFSHFDGDNNVNLNRELDIWEKLIKEYPVNPGEKELRHCLVNGLIRYVGTLDPYSSCFGIVPNNYNERRELLEANYEKKIELLESAIKHPVFSTHRNTVCVFFHLPFTTESQKMLQQTIDSIKKEREFENTKRMQF